MARRKKDVLAGGADSDQDEEVEEFFGNETNKDKDRANPDGTNFTRAAGAARAQNDDTTQGQLKKKRIFYYYALVFEVEFEYDYDTVYFAFSQPYTYT